MAFLYRPSLFFHQWFATRGPQKDFWPRDVCVQVEIKIINAKLRRGHRGDAGDASPPLDLKRC